MQINFYILFYLKLEIFLLKNYLHPGINILYFLVFAYNNIVANFYVV